MIIEINNLNKSYKNNIIFSGFNFKINEQDFLVIYGASGVGKSTLLNMIGTIESYDDGNILYENNNNKLIVNKRVIRNEYISYLYQDYFLIENKTVFENLKIALLDKKMNKNETKEKILDCLNVVGLTSKIDEYVYTLSGGEQQRIALARCLLRDTPIILADEPTGNLDAENKKIVIDLLKILNDKGKTIVVATHDEEFKKIAKRVILLK